MRFKEGIDINKGLLALGNVVSALRDEKKQKDGGHVPYCDSKLTWLLQDSLSENNKIVMIGMLFYKMKNCDNCARNIQNKAVINRDSMAAQMQRMNQIKQLQAENLFYHGDSSLPFGELLILKHKVSLLEASNAELQRELQECRVICEHLTQRALDVKIEIKRTISKGSGQSKDFKTKKIFVGGIPPSVFEMNSRISSPSMGK